MTTLLSVEGVSKNYGALTVTDNITFTVPQGATLGILGPNGAGKTTLFNLIAGDVRQDKGRIVFGASDVSAMAPHKRCRQGIGRSYQIPQPYNAMTVLENCLVAASFGGGLTEQDAGARSVDVLARTGLLKKANQLAGGLALLDRKRLELARALSTGPRLLLLDEIAGGLTEYEAKSLVEQIMVIKEQGVTMVWIEHVVHALLAVADTLMVLNFGAKLAEGEPAAVMNDPQVQRVYMGMQT
ncbi:MAG TPA: ABC transporter ATP-binding protein [Eoetvoesiella sp.]|uniref:ABC transporter ATP-binding protein n=1 Tax=Eoetvoesiella sp. TaxID=1966355 RepID=UPI002CE910B4|nr:ABC transporter ATP-binding protein [Eoetvoesiella sp.]HWK62884.1 ABC transporter ATP-binding protein [Eoetvoesiella sp.]